ncbi:MULTISPECIES: YeeE/YedE family protein [unclassified Rhizobium]|uniref:YeeE/YedE family protein n=1 Tax=unclassified Rhizobium TaxID=2613769 RepID=UPI001AD9B3EA|nr:MULTISPECIES: YeeE/YedE family protein [unclassified Rhizobium]MBO9099809.1 YeeE/YedE family protein [Rhizobium sp. L58/93]MBO9131649.1 YeeE/YedE family protein [Rhizobium sp. B209b/85]MBO9169798.1 YeeE/YedE family protein [Rhizobium sp. L245/93]MBO9185756.1 YeeE/YedE family protein [Rhizobium sp. E27B/91]QXZ82519.1 YeeE/YedE family protein [Rhizobium sp. K1/93]
MNRTLLRILASLASGIVFGSGLALSGMLNPARVQGFLDVFGAWDPSLAFVLGGAVLVAFIGVRIMKRMKRPVLDDSFRLPSSTAIDSPLIAGAALFGIGWGLGGFCPGPAMASLTVGFSGSFVFVIAMLVGMALHDRVWSKPA